MKYVKLTLKDILFYAPNWSDEKGTSNDRFSGFLSHKIEISRKKIFGALPWENLRLLTWPKNSNSTYFGQNSEMQNCQDYTDPTVHMSWYVHVQMVSFICPRDRCPGTDFRVTDVWETDIQVQMSGYSCLSYRCPDTDCAGMNVKVWISWWHMSG